MKERVLREIFSTMDNVTEEYCNSVSNRFTDFINFTQLPLVFQTEKVDDTRLPVSTQNLFNGIEEIINNRYSCCIQVADYRECGFLTSMFLEEYFKQCIKKDTHISTVLYIDTNLLMEDYKRLMDKNNDSMSPDLVHNLDVLYKQVEQAEFIFWDKFTMLQSNYEINKMYDILSIRYRNCLGNIFFINRKMTEMEQMSQELANVMNSNATIELMNEKFSHTK